MTRRVRGTSQPVEQLARDGRRDATPAEAKLWQALRAGRLDNLKFRRQHPVGKFILDFYCPAYKLAIELDGGYHAQQSERDAERDAILAAYGYRVLRFDNDAVLNQLETVLEQIRQALTPNPSPPPSIPPNLGGQRGARGESQD